MDSDDIFLFEADLAKDERKLVNEVLPDDFALEEANLSKIESAQSPDPLIVSCLLMKNNSLFRMNFWNQPTIRIMKLSDRQQRKE